MSRRVPAVGEPGESGNNLGTIAPEHRGKPGIRADQQPRRVNKLAISALSAKPRPPVQIRAAPPILTSTFSSTCGFRLGVRFLRLGNSWEQPRFERFDRCAMRRVDDVRVDVERRLNARVPELLLRDLHRHAQIVEQRRMNVAELMPRHATGSRRFGGRLQQTGRDSVRDERRSVRLGLADRSTRTDTCMVLRCRTHQSRW